MRSDSDCVVSDEVTVDCVVSASKTLGDECVEEVISFIVGFCVSEELVSVPRIRGVESSNDDKSLLII